MSTKVTKDFEINDKELDTVSGGYYPVGTVYKKPEDVKFLFEIGQEVELVVIYLGGPFTKGCKIIDRKVEREPGTDHYRAMYKVSCSFFYFNNEWYPETEFEGGFTDVVYLDPTYN